MHGSIYSIYNVYYDSAMHSLVAWGIDLDLFMRPSKACTTRDTVRLSVPRLLHNQNPKSKT